MSKKELVQITVSSLRKAFPSEYKSLADALKAQHKDLYSLAYSIDQDDFSCSNLMQEFTGCQCSPTEEEEARIDAIFDALESLQKAFRKVNTKKLRIGLKSNKVFFHTTK